jgi:peptidoglycan/LPS O-acetylase OafA/YrhL
MGFDDDAFFSIWYWLLTAVFWSTATHFTHGVPADLIRRAARLGGEDAEIFERLARRSAELQAEGLRRWGAAGAALGGFALAALAVAGFAGGRDWAAGLFLLAGPGAAMWALSLNEAARVAARPDLDRDTLLEVWQRRRAANVIFGALSAGVAAMALALRERDRLGLMGAF